MNLRPCSNVQFIPSLIDVREFLLRLLNINQYTERGIDRQYIAVLHIKNTIVSGNRSQQSGIIPCYKYRFQHSTIHNKVQVNTVIFLSGISRYRHPLLDKWGIILQHYIQHNYMLHSQNTFSDISCSLVVTMVCYKKRYGNFYRVYFPIYLPENEVPTPYGGG